MAEIPVQVQEFDTAKGRPPDDNRLADRPGIQRLIAGIRDNGQLVPGLICPDPAHPGDYQILDGVGRWYACSQLGILFRAILLACAVSEPERIKLRLQHNVIRRNMTAEEIADDATRYMRLTDCTQEDAARQLNLSSASLSRALTVNRRLPPDLKAKAETVRPSIVAMIAALPKVESMGRALEYAATAGPNGRQPTRDQMVLFLDQFKEKKPRGSRPKALKGMVEGRKVELGLLPGESTDSVIKFLTALATKIGKYRDLPPDNLDFLFRS